MKIAIVCDDLIQHGGAEKVLLTALELWPQADLYTSVISSDWRQVIEAKQVKVFTSFMQKLPLAEKLNRYYSVLLLHIFAMTNFDFSEYDLVLSFSSRYAHMVVTKPKTVHVCYLHSPGRMFWEPFDYFFTVPFLRILGLPMLSLLRLFDYYFAQQVGTLVSNSLLTQKRAKKYYKRESQIIYPFVGSDDFFTKSESRHHDSYFLVISRLAAWKKIGLAIQACESLGLRLKIIGAGPDLGRLKSISNGSTEFLGLASLEEKRNCLKNCKAVINTQREDFGIVPLEAMACGKPVIAFGQGGVLETVIKGITGEYFYQQDADSLKKVLEKFDCAKYNSDACIQQAKKFTKDIFCEKLKKLVDHVYLENN